MLFVSAGVGRSDAEPLPRDVASTVVDGRDEYCAARLAPRPRVAPTMSTVAGISIVVACCKIWLLGNRSLPDFGRPKKEFTYYDI